MLFSVTNASCGNADGGVSLNVTGGTFPYTYQWTSGDTTSNADSLSSAIYVVTVTDAQGCQNSAIALVNDNGAPVITVNSVTNLNCYGNGNGAIDVGISGGTPPYNIEWSDGALTEDITGLTAGPYEIIVTDNNGCVASESITLTQPAVLTATAIDTAASCGASNGSATINVTGGNPPYSYLWSNGAITPNIQLLTSNVYFVTITDANGCIDSVAVPVSEIGGPTVTVDSVIDVNCGSSNGVIYINATNGTSPYSYLWSNGDTIEDITGLNIGQFSVTVTGANGCRGTMSDIVVKAIPLSIPIAFVTVDSITQKNNIVWRSLDTVSISHFNLYRESSQQGNFYLLAQIPYDSLIIFFDTLSKPNERSWKYKISVVDLCGRESYLSNGHRTIHLKAIKHPNYIRLSWNHYEGFGYEYFYIYRSVEPGPYLLLDSVPLTENQYIDSFMVTGILHYIVEVIDTSSNVIFKAVGGDHNTVRSNDEDESMIIGPFVAQISNGFDVKIYPNPNEGKFYFSCLLPEKTDIIINIFDMLGKKIYSKRSNKISGKIYESIDMTPYSKGSYNAQIITNKHLINKVIIYK